MRFAADVSWRMYSDKNPAASFEHEAAGFVV